MPAFAVLETGGTINGILSPEHSVERHSRVMDWLHAAGHRPRCEFVSFKDSRALDDADREALLKEIESSPEDQLLIPHGTFTMAETGVYLHRHLGSAAADKTVVLVGALVPLEEPDSDAPAALEFALSALTGAGPGVWVAMNGRVWRPQDVVKDPDTGEFVERPYVDQ